MVPRIRVRKVRSQLQLQFEGGDGGFDSDECSDDGESRRDVVVLPSLTPLYRGADQDKGTAIRERAPDTKRVRGEEDSVRFEYWPTNKGDSTAGCKLIYYNRQLSIVNPMADSCEVVRSYSLQIT